MNAMTIQNLIVLLAVALAGWFIFRRCLRSATGKGCASGCGACRAKDCAMRKQEAQRAETARPRE